MDELKFKNASGNWASVSAHGVLLFLVNMNATPHTSTMFVHARPCPHVRGAQEAPEGGHPGGNLAGGRALLLFHTWERLSGEGRSCMQPSPRSREALAQVENILQLGSIQTGLQHEVDLVSVRGKNHLFSVTASRTVPASKVVAP